MRSNLEYDYKLKQERQLQQLKYEAYLDELERTHQNKQANTQMLAGASVLVAFFGGFLLGNSDWLSWMIVGIF